MMTVISCQHCGKKYWVDPAAPLEKQRCWGCGQYQAGPVQPSASPPRPSRPPRPRPPLQPSATRPEPLPAAEPVPTFLLEARNHAFLEGKSRQVIVHAPEAFWPLVVGVALAAPFWWAVSPVLAPRELWDWPGLLLCMVPYIIALSVVTWMRDHMRARQLVRGRLCSGRVVRCLSELKVTGNFETGYDSYYKISLEYDFSVPLDGTICGVETISRAQALGLPAGTPVAVLYVNENLYGLL